MTEQADNKLDIFITHLDDQEPTGQSFWERVEPAAKAISLIAIPLVVALSGWWIQSALKDRELSKEYVEMALSVLVEEEANAELRQWAVALLNENSPTQFTPEISQKLISGELNLSSRTIPSTTILAQPFNDFQMALGQIQINADQLMSIEEEKAFANFIKNAEAADPRDLWLQFGESTFDADSGDFEWGGDDYTQGWRFAKKSRSDLMEINKLLILYSDFLLLLTSATEEATSQDIDTDSMAAELGAMSATIATRTGREPDLFKDMNELAHSYLTGNRQQSLVELIRSNQEAIESISKEAQDLIETAAIGIKVVYQTSSRELMRSIVIETDPDARLASIEKLLDVNETTTDRLDTQHLIFEAYKALPAAHRQLAQSNTQGATLAHTNMLTYANALKGRYESLTRQGD